MIVRAAASQMAWFADVVELLQERFLSQLRGTGAVATATLVAEVEEFARVRQTGLKASPEGSCRILDAALQLKVVVTGVRSVRLLRAAAAVCIDVSCGNRGNTGVHIREGDVQLGVEKLARLLWDTFLSQPRAAETVESATLVVEEKGLTQLLRDGFLSQLWPAETVVSATLVVEVKGLTQLLRDEFRSQLWAAETVESATLVVEIKGLTQLLRDMFLSQLRAAETVESAGLVVEVVKLTRLLLRDKFLSQLRAAETVESAGLVVEVVKLTRPLLRDKFLSRLRVAETVESATLVVEVVKVRRLLLRDMFLTQLRAAETVVSAALVVQVDEMASAAGFEGRCPAKRPRADWRHVVLCGNLCKKADGDNVRSDEAKPRMDLGLSAQCIRSAPDLLFVSASLRCRRRRSSRTSLRPFVGVPSRER